LSCSKKLFPCLQQQEITLVHRTLKRIYLIISLVGLIINLNSLSLYAQGKLPDIVNKHAQKQNSSIGYLSDTTEKKTKTSKFSFNGIFISAGGGLNVPVVSFNDNSIPAFGILGRLEFSSTSIFPFIIGGEVSYFSYNGADLFKTTNLLTNYKTKILSYGLNIEYVLSKFFNSSYTIPFVTIDIKNNNINREYDEAAQLPGLPRSESKISVGAGFGFTLFIFDFYAKYNYMEELQNFGVYTKIKFPLIKF
jgi:hypothetical protein